MSILSAKLDEKYSHRNFALGTIYLSAACYPGLIFEDLRSPKEQCVRYFSRFHHKTACFRDLQSYVSDLSTEDQGAFVQEIGSIHGEAEVFLTGRIVTPGIPPQALQRNQFLEI